MANGDMNEQSKTTSPKGGSKGPRKGKRGGGRKGPAAARHESRCLLVQALYQWLEEYEEGTGEELELDVIGLCCDFTEYRGLYSELINDYPDIRCMEDLEEKTQVIRASNGHIIIFSY